MNYMPEIAKMLGLEIGEEFMIRNPVSDFIFDNLRYKITERGLLERNINDSKCYESFLLIAILYGKFEIVKLPKPILDDEEKKYLSRVIRPFRKSVKGIYKINSFLEEYEFIRIHIKDEIQDYGIPLPSFKKGTMYKGMESYREYTVEELQL